MKLGVIVTTGDLFDIFFLAIDVIQAFSRIGNDEVFVGVGNNKSLAGSGEEEGGSWGGWGGGIRRRVVSVGVIIHEWPPWLRQRELRWGLDWDWDLVPHSKILDENTRRPIPLVLICTISGISFPNIVGFFVSPLTISFHIIFIYTIYYC